MTTPGDQPGPHGYFMDHEGSLVGPWPLEPYPVGRDPFGAWNHRLMRPSGGQLVQAISWCGKRAHKAATGPVDCPECLEAIAEDARALPLCCRPGDPDPASCTCPLDCKCTGDDCACGSR